MAKKYIVQLADWERKELEALTEKGTSKARNIRRARILLMADEGHKDDFISFAVGCSITTIERTRKRCVLEGLEVAISGKPLPGGKPKLSGREEAIVIALACSEPPKKRSRWTLRLLAEKAVEYMEHDYLSYETIRKTLKKTNLNLGDLNHGASAI